MRLFVTGAAGFIGREVCAEAVRRGHSVLGLVRETVPGLPGEVQQAAGTLGELPWQRIEAFEPEGIIHLAWITQPGVYLNSDENATLLEQSRDMLERLMQAGIKRIAVAGTCLEYHSAIEPLDEYSSPLVPAFPYTKAKMELWQWLQDEAEKAGTSAAWLRIFYPYGPGEHQRRLPTLIMRQLGSGQKMLLRTPESIKDYIYVTDLAAATLEVIEQGLTGPVNLGSGTGVKIRDLAATIAEIMKISSDQVGNAPVLDNDPWPFHVAKTNRLAALGWAPRVGLADGMRNLWASLGANAV